MNEVGNNGTNQPTENGTGEDAAVKDVVEMINALPAAETITEETDLATLKTQISDIRAAYDALSDDQKAAFNADVLGKLTALEVKISELESNDQETKPSDAVQAVVDAINDLPAVETITEETDLVSLKDQVNAARTAYDALTAEQKESFDATVLEKLTALEAKISELESGNQETESSEAVQNVIEKIDAAVEQIDYTTETIPATDGTTVTKTHITMLKDLDPANNAELKALIDKEAAHEQDETQPALTSEEAAKLSDARKVFEDAKAKYLSLDFSNAQLAARQAYDALATEEEKAQVTNYSLLEDMEANIAYIMQAVNTLPEGEDVAMIGDKGYKTLDEAIADAEDGDTIEVLQDCTTQNGFSIYGKSLTIDGNNHAITVDNLGIYLLNNGSNIAELTFKNCKQLNISPVSGTPTAAGNSAPWASVIVSFDCILTFDNCTVNIQQPIGDTKVHTGLYYHVGSKINLNNTVMSVTGFTTNGFSADVNDEGLPYTSELNVLNDSNLTVSQNRAGLTAALKVTVTDSKLTNSNNRGYASNGADYFITDSKVDISANGGHGMSARNVEIVNSNVTCEGNGGYGLNVTRSLTIDTSSTLDVIGNSWAGDDSGLQINDGAIANIAAGATVNIKGNKSSGLSNWGTCTFEKGSKLTITGNSNYQTDKSYGGGIYSVNHRNRYGIQYYSYLTLPPDAVIYNNHAKAGGDDIYNTGEITFSRIGDVEPEWILDDTNLPITGWYFDGNNNGKPTKRWKQDTQEDSYQLFNDFDDTGRVTLTGIYALKAAHAYSYDPETPVNPGTEWQVPKSKTATNLDANYQSRVTLSLPSASYKPTVDVVMVMDVSSSMKETDIGEAKKAAHALCDQLAEKNKIDVKIGIVTFDKDAHNLTDGLVSIDEARTAIDKITASSDTNMMAGLIAGKAMLDSGSASDKYLVLMSDGIPIYWVENGQVTSKILMDYAQDKTTLLSSSPAGVSPEGDYPDASQVVSMNDLLSRSDWDVDSNEWKRVSDTGESINPDCKYTNIQKAAYKTATYLSENILNKYKVKMVAFGTDKYKDNAVYKYGENLCDWIGSCPGVSYYKISKPNFGGAEGELKNAFEDIANEMIYLVDAGSSIVDVIGEGIDNAGNEYDFKFINDINNLNLTVGGVPLNKTTIVENTSYGFGEKLDNGKYEFELTYYPDGIGKEARSQEVIAGELFRLDINVPITIDKLVQLTYTVQLTNPQTTDGTYGQYDEDGSEKYTSLYTNKEAILYPVDTNHNSGVAEYFQKPTVSYTISNGKPVDPPVDPEDPTPRPGGGGDEDDDTPTIINDTPVPTTTIDDEDVPLTDLPEDTVTIDDEEVPLKDIPNTGDMIPVPAMVAAVISIGGIALLMKKHK